MEIPREQPREDPRPPLDPAYEGTDDAGLAGCVVIGLIVVTVITVTGLAIWRYFSGAF
jgi:hypothetical protein